MATTMRLVFDSIIVLLLARFAAADIIVPQKISPHQLTGTSFGHPSRNATFDYVIVGGGTAGAVVAQRILENSKATVAIVEAGSFYELSNGNWSQVPFYNSHYVDGALDNYQPMIDWGLATEPLEGVGGRRFHYAQGKNLGGSSGRNRLYYHRAPRGYYIKFAEHVDDDSWNYRNMNQFLRKSARFNDPGQRHSFCNYSTTDLDRGPLQVGLPKWGQPIDRYAPDAFSSIGIDAAQTFTGYSLMGYGCVPYTVDPETGVRSSSSSSFLDMAFRSDRLTVYTNAMARNIVFSDGDRPEAKGVNITTFGIQPYTLSARREVVLSAGTWHSPQLLMVSGIGPRKTLEDHGIKVIKDLPGVGQNVRDTTNGGATLWRVSAKTTNILNNPEEMQKAIQKFNDEGSGPLASVGSDFWAFEKLLKDSCSKLSEQTRKELEDFPPDWPEIEYILASAPATALPGAIKDGSANYAAIAVNTVATKSRGNMTIRSSSTLDNPVINPGWLSSTVDQEVMVEGFKRARKAFRAISVKIGEEMVPGATVSSDADILGFIQKYGVGAMHHACASCAMGPVDSKHPDTVVDSKAKVVGVQKLRVVDASSLPFGPPGHTQGVVYGHAEKLASDILQGL